MINIYNKDCLKAMKEMSNNQFDLAIVDPPYGIGIDKAMNANKGKKGFKIYKDSNWDKKTPSQEYFNELFRISKNQIVWGANYMIDKIKKTSQGWIVWNKVQRDFTMSDAELAFSSFDRTIRCFDLSRGGAMGCNNKNGGKLHPTQKPVKLYEWLLMNYAKEGDKILDTHLGSGSIAIACHNLGYDLEGYELDKEYYDNALKRIKEHQSQLRLI